MDDVSGREDIQTLTVSGNGAIVIFCRLLAYVHEAASHSLFVYRLFKNS